VQKCILQNFVILQEQIIHLKMVILSNDLKAFVKYNEIVTYTML
jgi:hypothetical protein